MHVIGTRRVVKDGVSVLIWWMSGVGWSASWVICSDYYSGEQKRPPYQTNIILYSYMYSINK